MAYRSILPNEEDRDMKYFFTLADYDPRRKMNDLIVDLEETLTILQWKNER